MDKKTEFNIPYCIKCRVTKTTKRCNTCKKAYYCTKECQRLDWSKHKLTCISPLDIPELVLTETAVLLSSLPFLRLAACLRQYNKDLTQIPEDQEDYNRHVVGIISIQAKSQMPEKLRELGDYSYSVRFFDNTEKDWEFMLVPSRGEIKHKLNLDELPLLDQVLYDNLLRKGTLDGISPYTGWITVPTISPLDVPRD